MNNIRLRQTPAFRACLIALIYRNTRTSCLSLAGLCARFSHDGLRRVLFWQFAWSRRPWDCLAQRLVRESGTLILDDTTWQRWAKKSAAVDLVWSATLGRVVVGMQVVLLLWTDGRWKIPHGIRIWRKRGKSKVVLASELLREAVRRGLRLDYVLFDSWYAASSLLNVLATQGWQYIAQLKSNRLLHGTALNRKWPHRFGQVWGRLLKVKHEVLMVKDRCRFFVTNALTLTSTQVKEYYRVHQLIEKTFRLLKQEFGWGRASHQQLQAQNAHLHLSLYALCLVQVAAQWQTIYAYRHSLFRRSIPYQLLIAEELFSTA